MRIPYVGITDFETAEQAKNMLAVFEEARKEFHDPIERKLMVGIMMSYKTLNNIPSKWSSVWLPKENIKHVFLDHPLAYNTLHYADYNGDTKTRDLIEAVKYGGKNLHTLQLDMIWPSVEMVKNFRKEYSEIQIILQVGRMALNKIMSSPYNLVKQIEKYHGLIDFVLLDKSMGRGLTLDSKVLLPLLEAIINSDLDINIAVAGGLSPENIHLVKDLVEAYPRLSIDAQGKLRPSGNSLDPIDWKIAG